MSEYTTAVGTALEFQVDVTVGNSGGPVIDLSSGLSLGIVTHEQPCSGSNGNLGNSFEHNPLEFAINTFPAANTEYVDNGHPVGLFTGTMFRPWLTVQQGASAVASGGVLCVVTGSYNETLTLDTPMTVIAPVGPAIIGR